jgi:hypothetical protein
MIKEKIPCLRCQLDEENIDCKGIVIDDCPVCGMKEAKENRREVE